MILKDIRWIQRFQNFRKAFLKLKEAMEKGELNESERNGFVMENDEGFFGRPRLCFQTIS